MKEEYFLMIKKFPRKLLGVLLLSFLLNAWGINWGLPDRWHPDEITDTASDMLARRSLNPHFFAYGPLHYYEVILFANIPIKIVSKFRKAFRSSDKEVVTTPTDYNDKKTNSSAPTNAPTEHRPWWWSGAPLLLSRVLSVLLGTGTVLLVYLLAKTIFDPITALNSALLFTVSMGFVVYSHFATVDMSSTFWFTLSSLMSVYVWSRGAKKWYVLSGLTVGLAAAVKPVGVLALIPLIIAHIFKDKRNNSNLVIGMFMVVVGFLIGCPVALFSFFEFIDGFTKEFFFNTARIIDEKSYAYFPLLLDLKVALGLPLFLISICSLFYSIKFLSDQDQRAKAILLWSMLLPYYLSIGSHHISILWYTVYLIPFISILTGKMLGDFLNSKVKAFRIASLILFGVVISYSVMYSIAADLQFVRDSRYITTEWVLNNVPTGSKIEVAEAGGCVPNIPNERYLVVRRPASWNQTDWIYPVIQDRDNNKAYLFIRKAASKLELLTHKIGLSKQREPYIAWYERAKDMQASKNFDFSLKGLELRNPDYLILCYIEPYHFLKNSDEYQFYDSLFSGKTSYREITQIKFRFLSWIDTTIPFVNPKIYIFRRKDLSLGLPS